MDTSQHNLGTLFQQLGLASSKAEIEEFIASHRLTAGLAVADAPFWTPAQATFLREALQEDSDWAEEVDELAMLLSK
ncbi:DUF2789 domain-containing protein [Pseudomonas boanensis]|uniref:DUF2789 domain-containing protein n=1 Tax=Metapseudomonas boanensis TaxID=2822138 RepID=UPI0035D3D9AD